MRYSFPVVVLLVVLGGCKGTDGSVHQRTLPGLVGDDVCTISQTGTQSLPLCIWAGAADVVVWGEVIAVRSAPDVIRIWVDAGVEVWEFVDNCQLINPGLELELAVTRQLAGAPLSGNTLVLRVGHAQLEYFNPRPFVDLQGEMQWLSTGPTEGQSIVAGQHIGVAAHFVAESDIWSLMGEMLFAADDDGDLRMQQQNRECPGAMPLGLEGTSKESLFRGIEACSSDLPEATTRREALSRMWGPTGATPSGYMAGVCVDPT